MLWQSQVRDFICTLCKYNFHINEKFWKPGRWKVGVFIWLRSHKEIQANPSVTSSEEPQGLGVLSGCLYIHREQLSEMPHLQTGALYWGIGAKPEWISKHKESVSASAAAQIPAEPYHPSLCCTPRAFILEILTQSQPCMKAPGLLLACMTTQKHCEAAFSWHGTWARKPTRKLGISQYPAHG